MNGKGDKMRPFNGKTYRENFDRIFRKQKNLFEKKIKIIASQEMLDRLKSETKPTP